MPPSSHADNDPFDLERFVQAQAPTFDAAMRELREGRKRTHWIWYIFPQLRDLGRSERAVFYGIGSLEEARAFLAHPVLGPRFEAAIAAVGRADAQSLRQILGSPDDMKFCSCVTLFDQAAPERRLGRALERWPDGRLDDRTLDILRRT